MSESPTIEEPIVEEPVVETPVDDAHALAERLTELGIDDVTKVEGTVKAAQEAGRLANMLGEERAAKAEVERQLREATSQRVDTNYDDSSVDLESVLQRGMEKFWDKKQVDAQKVQQRQMHEYQKIRSHKNYALVGKDFEEYTKSPDYQNELMMGKSPSEIFYDMSNDKLREHLITMRDALLKGTKSPESVDIPHTETSQASPPAAEPDNEKSDKLKQIKKDWKGDDSDIKKVLDVIL